MSSSKKRQDRRESRASRSVITKMGGLFMVAALVAACGSGTETTASSGGAAEKIKVAPVSPSPILWAPVWLAEELGYYKEEKLDVEIVSNLSGGAVENALRLGDLDFGATNQSRLIPLTAKDGANVITMFMPESNYLFRVMVPAGSAVKDAKDLVGKNIGVTEAGGDEDTVALLMGLEGIERTDYKTTAVGGRSTAGVALKRGTVDAYMGSFADQDAIENSGVDVDLIPMGDTAEFYNSGVAATPETLKDRRDVAVRYGRALAKATVWTHENPEASIEALAKITPEAVQDRKASVSLMKASTENSKSIYEARGETDEATWTKMIDALKQADVIDKNVAPADFLTSDLLEDIWDFDIEAVKAAARANEHP